MAHPGTRGMILLACLGLALLPPLAAAQPGGGAPGFAQPPAQLWGPLNPGQAYVSTAAELLQALEQNVGEIILLDDIKLTAQDWSKYEPPILIQGNGTTWIHSADDSGIGVRPRTLDWGAAMNLLQVQTGSTLAFEDIVSSHPGNFTAGEQEMQLKNNGSFVWPTNVQLPDSNVVLADSLVYHDDPRCSPETVERAMTRLGSLFPGTKWLGGLQAYLPYLPSAANSPFPMTVFDMLLGRATGNATYILKGVTSECFNSLAPVNGSGSSNSTSGAGSGSSGGSTSGGSTSSGSDSGGSGTPSWVWAIVGSVLGCAALAAVVGAFLWRHKRRAKAARAAAEGKLGSAEAGLVASPFAMNGVPPSGSGSGGGSDGHGHSGPRLSSDGHQLSGSASSVGALGSGGLPSQLLRTRFGPIDGLQLGDLLGRGGYGKVYRGRWRGAIVAVKVVDSRVQPGKTHDLSREPLLSMSVSHPNVVATHKMCIVKVLSGSSDNLGPPTEGALSGMATPTSPSISGGSWQGRRATGPLVPAIDGSGMVEVVDPHAILMPGLYETWLVCEYCDRGSLSDLLSGGKLNQMAQAASQSSDPTTQAAHRDAWLLLCLLDIAQGLDYLHEATIVHGDLKPANVMLKGARNDRRGFVCKLGDFGLSRMLGIGDTHVETENFGTAAYAAPELLTEGRSSPKADIYSLGLIMWEMASGGQELYAGLTTMQLILQVSQHGLRPKVPEGCSPALAELMQRCWHKDPAQRPTAAQVVEEVRSQLLALRQPLMQRAQQQQQQQQQAAVQLPVQKRASPLLAPADTPPQLPQLPAGQEVSPFTDAAQQAVPLTSAQASPFAQPPATPDEE